MLTLVHFGKCFGTSLVLTMTYEFRHKLNSRFTAFEWLFILTGQKNLRVRSVTHKTRIYYYYIHIQRSLGKIRNQNQVVQ